MIYEYEHIPSGGYQMIYIIVSTNARYDLIYNISVSYVSVVCCSPSTVTATRSTIAELQTHVPCCYRALLLRSMIDTERTF